MKTIKPQILKKKIADNLIQDNIAVMIGISHIKTIQITVLRLSHKIKLRVGFSYWNSLILASALKASCFALYFKISGINKLLKIV